MWCGVCSNPEPGGSSVAQPMSVCRRVLLSNRQTVEGRAHAPPDDENRRTVSSAGVHACGSKPVCGLSLGGGGRTRNDCSSQVLDTKIYMNIFDDLIRNKSKNKGLISADRRTKPTLMLTIPRSEQSRLQWIYLSQRLKLRSSMMLRPRPYRYARHIGRGEYRRFPPWIQT